MTKDLCYTTLDANSISRDHLQLVLLLLFLLFYYYCCYYCDYHYFSCILSLVSVSYQVILLEIKLLSTSLGPIYFSTNIAVPSKSAFWIICTLLFSYNFSKQNLKSFGTVLRALIAIGITVTNLIFQIFFTSFLRRICNVLLFPKAYNLPFDISQ